MSKRAWMAAWVSLAGLLSSNAAFAHIRLKSPVSRDPNNEQKSAPCGPSGNLPRGTTMMVLAPGAKLTVMWDETVQHPGHYRIAFDNDGQDFADPKGFDDIGETGDDLGQGVTILLDGIPDKTGPVIGMTPYTAEVTMPDIECENCTLQLIQVMTDKPPYGDDNDIYHECANIVLRRAGGSGGAGGAAAGTGGAAAGSGGAAAGSGGRGAAGTAAGSGTAGMNLVAGSPGGSAGAGMSAAGTAAGAPVGTAGMVAPPPTTAGSLATGGTAAPAPAATSDGGCSVAAARASGGLGAFALLSLLATAVGLRSRRRRISSRRERSRRG